MKYRILFSLLSFSLMGSVLMAQRASQPGLRTVPYKQVFDEGQAESVIDTLYGDAFSLPCGDQVTISSSSGWGFITGTNDYEDVEKAQRISLGAGSNFSIQEVWGFFASASVVGDGPLRAKIYDVDAEGAPGNELATSADINVSDIDISETGIVPTIFTFSTPVMVSDTQIFASIDVSGLYATEDTVGLWMSEEGCGSGSDAYELWGDGSGWFAFNSPSSWGAEINLLIGIVVDFDVVSAYEPSANMNGLRMFPAYPNPTTDDIRIPYHLSDASEVRIEVFSNNGRLIQSIHKGYQTPGEFLEVVRTSNLPTGTYVYGVTTDKARLMSRFVVRSK